MKYLSLARIALLEYVGVAPKNFASMARYQYLWNECIYNKRFNIADAAYQYGYSDQQKMWRLLMNRVVEYVPAIMI